jgi:uncharacterized protein YutE (UPF0331/DUF86 family)
MPLTERERELLRLLDIYLQHLQQHQSADPAAITPFDAVDAAVQRWLQLAIQCCLDLGDSLLGKLGEPEPPRYRDIFAALERRGIIDASLARNLEALTDFRNTLAHAYEGLSPGETWRQLRQGLQTMAEFAKKMSQQ